jgi:serine/threonine protein kinase
MVKYAILESSLASRASKADEIYREALALKKLNHPNIVKLHHTFMQKHYIVLIMVKYSLFTFYI